MGLLRQCRVLHIGRYVDVVGAVGWTESCISNPKSEDKQIPCFSHPSYPSSLPVENPE